MAGVTDVAFEDIRVRSEVDLLGTFEQDYLETKIADAVALIIDRVPTVPARLAEGTLSENNYKRVVFDVCMRVFRNPGGMAAESEGNYSYSTNNLVASGNFWLTADDIRTLTGLQSPVMIGSLSMDVDEGWARAAR